MGKKFFELFVPVWAMGLQPCESHFPLKLVKHAGHSSIGVKCCKKVILASWSPQAFLKNFGTFKERSTRIPVELRIHNGLRH